MTIRTAGEGVLLVLVIGVAIVLFSGCGDDSESGVLLSDMEIGLAPSRTVRSPEGEDPSTAETPGVAGPVAAKEPTPVEASPATVATADGKPGRYAFERETDREHDELARYNASGLIGINCAEFSQDGSRVLAGTGDGHVGLFDSSTWQLLPREGVDPRPRKPPSGAASSEKPAPEATPPGVEGLRKVLDFQVVEEHALFIVFSPDDSLVALPKVLANGLMLCRDMAAGLVVWDLVEGKQKAHIGRGTSARILTAGTFSRDGGRLVTAGLEHITLWEFSESSLVKPK